MPLSSTCKDVLSQYSTKLLWNYFENPSQIFMPIFMIISFFIIIYRFPYNIRNHSVWRIGSDKLWYFALVVLAMGFILYFIGYSHQIKGMDEWLILGSIIQAGLRALISSLGMFVFDTDFIEVGEAYHHNIWYLNAFAIVHMLGVLITTHVILRLLGERFLSSRLMSRILNKSNKRDIFVFWGINEESLTLAESIKEKYLNHEKEKKDKNDIELLFVETPSEKELEIKEHSLSHFFSSSLHGSSEKDRIDDLNGTILYPRRRLIDVDKELSNKKENKQLNSEEKELNKNGKEIFKKLGLPKLFKLCSIPYNVHFFFFSDDEQKNIQDTLIIQTVFSKKALNHELNLYCKSRDNYANRAIINAKGLFVTKLIDEASLSIKTLKEMSDNKGKYVAHPVNFVDPDPDRGVVRNPFTALIIGFGTAGQDALRFLYEYGSFIKSPGEESPFKCYVIDKNMNNIKGQFFREVPVLESNERPESMRNITFMNNDWNSEEFKKVFTSDILNELNYVILTTGEDKSNSTIAAELYEYVLKNRKDGVSNFRIFVKVYNKDNEEQMKAVSKFYEKNDENNATISVFGKLNDIYTYQNIINDEEKENKAKEFFEIYQKVSNGNEIWEEREKKIKSPSTPYHERLELIHKKGQDLSVVLHMYTKLKLCKYLQKELPDWTCFPFTTEPLTNIEEDEKNFKECMNNLSELEHLRWNAAHYMAGFVYAPQKKDFRKKNHKCIKPFWELDDVIKRYDYAIVITTIELNKRKPLAEYRS